jgi:hypothetical protein
MNTWYVHVYVLVRLGRTIWYVRTSVRTCNVMSQLSDWKGHTCAPRTTCVTYVRTYAVDLAIGSGSESVRVCCPAFAPSQPAAVYPPKTHVVLSAHVWYVRTYVHVYVHP